MYQAELERCGFDHKLKYKPKDGEEGFQGEKRTGRGRHRRITWFNPPYSMEVATNVGKEFLK